VKAEIWFVLCSLKESVRVCEREHNPPEMSLRDDRNRLPTKLAKLTMLNIWIISSFVRKNLSKATKFQNFLFQLYSKLKQLASFDKWSLLYFLEIFGNDRFGTDFPLLFFSCHWQIRLTRIAQKRMTTENEVLNTTTMISTNFETLKVIGTTYQLSLLKYKTVNL
jgi:hypothetical protein